MNDQGELRHGIDLWVPKCLALIGRITPAQSGLLGTLTKFFDDERRNPTARPFVASLATEGDSPYHWNAYGDAGRGVAVEVNFQPDAPGGNSILLPVLYDDSAKQGLIDKALGDLEATVNRELPHVQAGKEAAFLRSVVLAIIQSMLIHSSRFKTAGWSHELEWRVITFVSTKKCIDPKHGPIRFRSRQSALVDFIELKLMGVAAAISGCRLGPKTPVESHAAWRLFLSSAGFQFSVLSTSARAIG